ncbi:MAG: hypothetical protein RQ859_02765 [Pyrobaculum sp.]|nr:hypothetical protein [Pyrobaculum sp.]
MRGQALVLAGLILTVAVVVVMMALYTAQSSPAVAFGKPSYGYISRSWPDLVKVAGGYLSYVASQTGFTLARGSLEVGLYGRPWDAYWLHYNETQRRASAGLASMSAAMSYLQVNASGGVWYRVRGFNGTLGPYPFAAEYSNWNLAVVTTGVSIPCGSEVVTIKLVPLNARAARFVVQSPVDVNVEYVLTYIGHTSDIVSIGAGYNDILSDMLRVGNPNGRLALYVFDSSVLSQSQICGRSDGEIVALVQSNLRSVPWYAEIYRCPLCLLHFKVPPTFLQRGRVSEVLITYSTAPLQPPQFKVIITRQGSYAEYVFDVASAYTTSNPRQVFPSYFSADDIATWGRAVVRTDGVCYYPPSGGVVASGVAPSAVVPQGTAVPNSVRIYATYSAGTVRYGFNVYTAYTWNNPSVGFKVEALVLPENVGFIRPTRLDIYASNPATTHPICANMYAVQVVNPAIIWSWWRIGGGNIWNGRTWDVGYVVYSDRQWYLLSFALTPAGVAQWSVYHYNSSGRPMKLLGVTTRSGVSWLQNFYIVLGSAIVDNPGSTTSAWTEATYYAYVRVRPWVHPEPSVSLAPLDKPPLVAPVRQDLVALERSEMRLRLDATLDMPGALVRRLNATTWLNASAVIVDSCRARGNCREEVHQRTLWYLINVTHSEPRAALSSQFFVYYVLGNSPRNITATWTLYDYGDRWARFNVTFTVPRRAPFAILISVSGSIIAKLAVSDARPRVYYLPLRNPDGSYTYYVMNYGDGVAVFYMPWGAVQSFDDGWDPRSLGYAGYFGALYNVTNGRERWQVLVVPPGGLVKFRTPAQTDLRYYSPTWQVPYITQISTPCQPLGVYRLLAPTNITTNYYIFAIDGVSATVLSSLRAVYIYGPHTGGVWRSAPFYIERSPTGALLPRVWVRVDAPPGSIDYGGMLAVLCPASASSENKDATFGSGNYGTASSSAFIGARANLATFPDGFTVDLRPTSSSSIGSWGLANATSLPSISCSVGQSHVAIYYTGSSPPYWWHFDGFCFDRHIWEKQGGTPYFASISLSRQFVLYRMWTSSFDETGMWRRSYPNAPVSLNRPYVAYQYVVALFGFEWRIRPFAWPEPYVRD